MGIGLKSTTDLFHDMALEVLKMFGAQHFVRRGLTGLLRLKVLEILLAERVCPFIVLLINFLTLGSDGVLSDLYFLNPL